MTFCVENETSLEFPFPVEDTIQKIITAVLEAEDCPYETEVNILITDSVGIRTYNRQFRGIDKETDVLSFPNIDYEFPADFSLAETAEAEYFNLDTGELYLGDIILCGDKVMAQAKEYEHSLLREFAFLITHSMLHLLGYDHKSPIEEENMIRKQETVLDKLKIRR